MNRRAGILLFQFEQNLFSAAFLSAAIPAEGQHHRQRRLVARCRGDIVKPLQAEGGGERLIVVEIPNADQQRRFVAGFGVEIPSRNLADGLDVVGR